MEERSDLERESWSSSKNWLTSMKDGVMSWRDTVSHFVDSAEYTDIYLIVLEMTLHI